MKPRILLADDHSLILKGIKGLVETHYEVVELVDNGKAAVEAALRHKPDVVILDITMPILNGIDAMREVKRQLPQTKVIILTMHSSPIYLRKALEAGASGYVLKSGAAEELLEAIAKVLKGGVYVTPAFQGFTPQSLALWRAKPGKSAIELTSRQRQILQLVAEGRQNKEIAHILKVSVKTVEFHRSRIMAKAGAHSVAELTKLAIQEGLIDAAFDHQSTQVEPSVPEN